MIGEVWADVHRMEEIYGILTDEADQKYLDDIVSKVQLGQMRGEEFFNRLVTLYSKKGKR